MKSSESGILTIDTSKPPVIYQTNNPKYYGKWCIDYQPETVPTIAGFDSYDEAVDHLVSVHGIDKVKVWALRLHLGKKVA